MNVVVDFDTIHGNAYTLAEALEALNIGPEYQYSQNHASITEKDHGR